MKKNRDILRAIISEIIKQNMEEKASNAIEIIKNLPNLYNEIKLE